MTSLYDPLSYEEQDRIDAVLARKNGGYIQTFSALDGMLAAVVCSPDLIMPSEYLPIIQAGETEDDHLSFEDEKEAEDFFRLIMRHYNTVLNQIRDELCPKVGDGLKRAAYHGGVQRRRRSHRERICHHGQIYSCPVRSSIGIFS